MKKFGTVIASVSLLALAAIAHHHVDLYGRQFLLDFLKSLLTAALAAAFLVMLVRMAERSHRPPLAPALAMVAMWALVLLTFAPGEAHAAALVATTHTSGGLGAMAAAGLGLGLAPVSPPVTPGSQTSEFSLTKYVMIFGSVLAAIGSMLAMMSAVLPSGSKPAIYVGSGIAVIGALMKVAIVLGYQDSRSQVKVAAMSTAAADTGAEVRTQAEKSPADAASALAKIGA